MNIKIWFIVIEIYNFRYLGSDIIKFFKPKKPPLLASFRPICQLPFLSKVCKKNILKSISIHNIPKNILSHSQFKFCFKDIITIYKVHRVIDATSLSFEKKP